MGHYVNLEMTDMAFSNIVQYLEILLPKLDNYYDIEEVVHLIDLLVDLKHKDKAEKNIEMRKDLEIQELFEQYYKDSENIQMEDISLFYKIQSIVKGYCGIDLDIETEFYFIMNVINLFKEEYINE